MFESQRLLSSFVIFHNKRI